MTLMSSLFQRRVKTLMWVSVALLAILPVLALIQMGIKISENGKSSLDTLEIVILCGFVFFSIIGGLTILVFISNRLREITQKTLALNQLPVNDAAPAARPPGATFQSELASMSDSLSRIQTDFLRNLQQLQQQASFLDNLQHVLNHSSDMVMMLNDRNNITFSNRSAREKLGVLPDTSIRRSLAEGLLKKEDAQRLSDLLENWEAVDEVFEFSRTDNGQLFVHCLQTVVNLQDLSRNKIIILRDMTERRMIENQLYRSEQLAALGQLISGVAHELNNPLAAVLGFAELSRDEKLTHEELNRNLEIIEREARRTAHIVENLLNFSRQRDSKRVPTNVHDLLERCFTLLAYNFRTNNVTVHRNYLASLPLLAMDEFKVQQVFMNLIINATQAMHQAGIANPTITAETSISPDRKDVLISLSDNGPGISPDVLPHIFEPFYTTKQDAHGTGLGLTVSRGIIRSHNGDIHVSTRPDAGTTFTVSLPLSEPLPMASAGRKTVIVDSRSVRGRVLVVDDEPSLLAMASQALRRHGVDVSTSMTVAEALVLIQQQDFDVIVADIRMPDGSGTQLRDFLQIFRPESACRIVFITGDPGTIQNLKKRTGDHPTLIKPFHVNELWNAVSALIDAAGNDRVSPPSKQRPPL